MSDKVHHVHSDSELDSLLSKPGLVVVDFSAAWCGPCKMIAPKFAELSNRYTNVTFVHVDIDELQSHSLVKPISSVPTFKLFKGGSPVTQMSGANASALENLITSNI
eukprot:TRINITY_DN1487_c0_g1_i1.p1 TRINITY_DN1487_c0_g1~~TRINITY_DN1487_c0_g1_i1.p1  ORF type:complete len:121 (+),score=15.80 TRINITY_DN1487_c0_g1_i1:45-365(+)